MLDFYVKTRIRFSLRDKRLFEITEVEITRVDCIMMYLVKVFAIAVQIFCKLLSTVRARSLSPLSYKQKKIHLVFGTYEHPKRCAQINFYT